MGFFAGLEEDWKSTKAEMKRKLGVKTPTETKSYNLCVKTIEQRLSSGIRQALKALDKATPKDCFAPNELELETFAAAVKNLGEKIQGQEEKILKELSVYGGDGEKVDKEKKDSTYRALKVFTARLKYYQAAAEERLGEYQNAGHKNTEQKKKLFVLAFKKFMTEAVSLIKIAKADPTVENCGKARDVLTKRWWSAFIVSNKEFRIIPDVLNELNQLWSPKDLPLVSDPQEVGTALGVYKEYLQKISAVAGRVK